jgi:hypothetical protein
MKWLSGGLLLLLLWLPGPVAAATWELGLRGGTDATGSAHSYSGAELYLLYPLDWQAAVAGGTLRPRLDGGVGWIEATGDHGGWVAAGADLVYALDGLPLEVEAGFRPLWFPDHRFGKDDFGGGLQFASHAGVALRLPPFVLSYRFQHISNGGIYDENSELNLHLFGIGASF